MNINFLKSLLNRKYLMYLLQKGSGNIYVIAILGTIVAGSALMVGGLVPELEPPTDSSKVVQIDPEVEPSEENNALELRSFGILTPTTPITPTNPTTPTPQVCFDKAAVAIVVDTSGSMETVDPGSTSSRMTRLKSALNRFLDFFNSESAMSLITFSGGGDVVVPMGKLGTNRTAIESAINNMQAAGSTNMRNGLAEAAGVLEGAETSLPNYNRFTVFFTDGVPESSDCRYRKPNNIYHYYVGDEENGIICRIEGTNTEPTFFTHKWSPIEPANTIKSNGARIFSVNMFRPSPEDPVETGKNNDAEALMRAVASDPDTTYYLSSPTTSNLTETYEEIARKICPS